MRTSKIQALIKLVEQANIDELEVSTWGRKVRIRKKVNGNENSNGNKPQVAATVPDRIIETVSANPASKTAVAEPEKKTEYLEIKSPMVGTFYRAPAPDAKPYIEVGARVSRGQVICIIEAMKIMNEIESEYDGRVVDIPVKNAQPVQFGQAMIIIEPV